MCSSDLYFVKTFANSYLMMQNSNNGYLLKQDNTFTKITNDYIASAVVMNGGGNYSEGTTVTFSAPTSGTTATGKVTVTEGVVEIRKATVAMAMSVNKLNTAIAALTAVAAAGIIAGIIFLASAFLFIRAKKAVKVEKEAEEIASEDQAADGKK